MVGWLGLVSGVSGMAGFRVRSWVVYQTYKSLHKDRSTRVFECVCIPLLNSNLKGKTW